MDKFKQGYAKALEDVKRCQEYELFEGNRKGIFIRKSELIAKLAKEKTK